jgi:hypothetical protein
MHWLLKLKRAKTGATRCLGIKHIVLKTYCLNFVNLWKRIDNQPSELTGVVQQIEMLSMQFDTYVLYNRIM